MDVKQFGQGISESIDLPTLVNHDLNDIVSHFGNCLTNVLDAHAPIQTKSIVIHDNCTWYNADIRHLKRKKRKAERIWIASKSEEDYTVFKNIRLQLNKLMTTSKELYYTSLINDKKDNNRTLFKVIASLTGKSTPQLYPDHTFLLQLANEFSDYFRSKIDNINDYFGAGNYPGDENNIVDPLISFNKVSECYVNEIIHRSPASTCELDPLLSHLMKRISDQCVPTVCTIINKSLMEGICPVTYKHALITPLIKKPGLPLVFSNYRPVSNLTFLSKVLERIVASQTLDHFARMNYLNHSNQHTSNVTAQKLRFFASKMTYLWHWIKTASAFSSFWI